MNNNDVVCLVVKLDDIIDFCNAQIPHLLARQDTIALAQLRGVKEFAEEYSFVLGDNSDESCCSHD